ncbi:retrovirus-related pol polyprotein from transposon TNT 1-94 [Tanacetum coccineum]
MYEDKIKKDLEEIETINIELDHRVSKLIAENEHLKQTYKQLYDSIKPARILSKEQCDDLINQVNLKSVEIYDLNASLQEKVLEITALKDDLRNLKRKALVDNAVTKHTINLEILKIDVEPITHKLINKKTAHSAYIKYTQEEATVLRDLVKHVKSKYPLDHSLESACRYIWRPTGQTFAIVENACPLTRITTTTEVPLRKLIALENETPKTVLKSVSANKKEPNQSWGSIVFDVLSSSLDECMSSKLFSEGVDLLTGFRDNNLYTLSLGDMMASSPICLLSKASKTNKKKPHIPKSEDTNQEKLYLLHMDLCGPSLVASVNGKSTSSSSLMINLDSHGTYNGTEFVNQTLRKYYEKLGISHETSIAHSSQQNSVIERRNRTLFEAARTMLIYAKALLFLWAEAVDTACYTQNRSIVRLRHGKTPYELLHDKPPNFSFFHVFGALCYPKNDSENLGKLQSKADIDFDELTAMASEHSSSGPTLYEMTPATISSGLVPNPSPLTSFVPPSRIDWDILFQPMFDELLTPPPSVDYPTSEFIALIHEVVAPVPAVSTGSPSSINVDQDAPSPSHSQTTPET